LLSPHPKSNLQRDIIFNAAIFNKFDTNLIKIPEFLSVFTAKQPNIPLPQIFSLKNFNFTSTDLNTPIL
jgi:hypothetical protein